MSNIIKEYFIGKKIILLFLVFMGACSSVKSPESTKIPLAQNPKGQTTQPYSNTIATTTATSEKVDTTNRNQSCWKTQPLNNNLSLEGGLIFYDYGTKELQVLDFASFFTKPFQNPNWSKTGWVNTDISSSGNIIADFEPSLQKIRIITKNLEKIYSLPEEGYFYDGFLANGQIRLDSRTALNRNFQNGIGTTDDYYLLSPDNGETKFHTLFLPFYWTSESGRNSYIQYSPNMQYVLYSADYQGKLTNILLDIEQNKIMWSGAGTDFGIPYFPLPVWKPDSSGVAFIQFSEDSTKKENFFVVSTSGQYSQLTNLDQMFSDDYVLLAPTWSPNGRYLAFIVSSPSKFQNDSLVLLDTESDVLIVTCASLRRDNFEFSVPVWSSNSNYLAFSAGDGTTMMIVDILKMTIYERSYTDSTNPKQLLGWINWKTP